MDNDLKQETIIRHGIPCKFDHAPYGTRCKIIHGEEYELYVQSSKDEANPEWELIGTFKEEPK